jgi:hypothetical protein
LKDLTVTDVCEFLVYNNIENIKSSKVIIIGLILTLGISYLLFSNLSMIFSDNIMIDYTINIIIFIATYITTTSIIMHFYILKIEKFILINIDILLFEVNLDNLNEAYEKAKKLEIIDEKLLFYLQNYKKN